MPRSKMPNTSGVRLVTYIFPSASEDVADENRTEHVAESAEYDSFPSQSQGSEVEHHEDAGEHDVQQKLVAYRAIQWKEKMKNRGGEERVSVRGIKVGETAENVGIPLGELVELFDELDIERAHENARGHHVASVEQLRARKIIGEKPDDECGKENLEEEPSRDAKAEGFAQRNAPGKSN